MWEQISTSSFLTLWQCAVFSKGSQKNKSSGFWAHCRKSSPAHCLSSTQTRKKSRLSLQSMKTTSWIFSSHYSFTLSSSLRWISSRFAWGLFNDFSFWLLCSEHLDQILHTVSSHCRDIPVNISQASEDLHSLINDKWWLVLSLNPLSHQAASFAPISVPSDLMKVWLRLSPAGPAQVQPLLFCFPCLRIDRCWPCRSTVVVVIPSYGKSLMCQMSAKLLWAEPLKVT